MSPRFALLVIAALALHGCRAPAPRPCKVDASAVPAKPVWAKPDEWATFALPQPGNGWISSIALSHDGKRAVYGGSIGGTFIPISEEVTLIRIDVGPDMGNDMRPSVLVLPGVALRNYAVLSWSPWGLAFGSRSRLGIATPETGATRKLAELPIGDRRKLDSFPFYSSVAWAPGGDCVAATLELPESKAELITWNASGARDASARHDIRPLEKIADWSADGVLLVWTSAGSPARARRMDPATGTATDAPAPPEDAQAFSWVSGGWLTVDRIGTVMHRVPGQPATLVASVTPALDLGSGERRKWLRALASPNGRALVVEESVVAPKKDLRHMHVLTPRSP